MTEPHPAAGAGAVPERPPAPVPRPADALHAGHGGRLRVGQWVVIVVAAFGTVLLAVLLAGLLAVNQSVAARRSLTQHVDPAMDGSARLSAAMKVQRLAAEESLPTEYAQARSDEAAATARLRSRLPDDAGLRSDLAAVSAAADRWHEQVGPALTRHVPVPPSAYEPVAAALDTQRNHLAAFQDATLHRVASAAAFLYLWLAVSVALLLSAGVLAIVALRRTVVKPLAQLSAQVGQVAGGEFDATLGVKGPAEVTGLAAGVDTMRRRIVAEWAFAIEARELLDRQADELRQSNAELEQFAYVASHDLQEPLRKVAGFCQMLERRYADQLDDRARQYIGFAVDGARRMQALINDLLTFSRVGRLTARSVAVDCGAVIRSTVDTLSVAREESGAEITWDPMPSVPGDPVLIGQLFQNLIGNAIKFRDDRTPRVHLSARRDGDLWEFSCTDNGIGIEPQYGERIFLVFQRLHPRDVYTGTGIGLALCRKIVEYHGGRIWLGDRAAPDDPDGSDGSDGSDRPDSSEGSEGSGRERPGATIMWTLPAAPDDAVAAPGSVDTGSVDTGTIGTGTIGTEPTGTEPTDTTQAAETMRTVPDEPNGAAATGSGPPAAPVMPGTTRREETDG